MFIQALLVALIVAVAFNDRVFLHTFMYRPIVIGPLVGLVFGNLNIGLQVGVAVELMFLAVIWVGTAVPPDETLSAAFATSIACATGSPEIGIATALPISFVGQIFRQTKFSTVYEWTMRKVEKAASKADGKGVILWTTIIPAIIESLLFGIPTFIGVYYGAEAVQAFINFIPQWLISGLAAGAGLLGAVGVALLLGTVKDKSLWPYFLIGFVFASYLGVNMIGIAIIAVACVAINYLADKNKVNSEDVEEFEIEPEDNSYRVLTKKDLWKTFWYGMAIESGNSATKQEANGFLQAMIPTLDKVYEDPAERAEAYERHCELFLTEGRVAELCVGISCAMEERNAIKKDIDPESINALKVALMGPLAGIGDSLIHGTIRPIIAGLACSMITASGFNNPTGAILFVVLMTAITFAIRYLGIFKGYEGGLSLVSKMQSGGLLNSLTRYAGIAAFVVCGGFISALVYVTLNVQYVNGDTIISLQKTLDDLIPNLIPLIYTMIMYWLINKKKINIVLLMFITILIGVAGVALGILA